MFCFVLFFCFAFVLFFVLFFFFWEVGSTGGWGLVLSRSVPSCADTGLTARTHLGTTVKY